LRDNSLFIAFAPVEKPTIALAIVVQNSVTPAPQIARKLLDYYLIPSSPIPTISQQALPVIAPEKKIDNQLDAPKNLLPPPKDSDEAILPKMDARDDEVNGKNNKIEDANKHQDAPSGKAGKSPSAPTNSLDTKSSKNRNAEDYFEVDDDDDDDNSIE
jgi:hypothetical protein